MIPPLISVILPTFNRSTLLPRAIRSVQRQTHTRWELLVVDDGSTDGTDRLMADLMERESRIRYQRIPHAGPAASRKHGLGCMTGSWAAFLDSDDEYAEDHLSLRAAYVAAHPEVDVLCGGFRLIGEGDRRSVPDRRDPARRIPIEECIVGGTFFCRAGIIQKAGGWRPVYGEDADLFERLQAVAIVRSVAHPTYLYHRDAGDSRSDSFRAAPGSGSDRTGP